MENDKNVYERLWKLWTMICKMVMDGVRDPEKVADALQAIVDQTKVYLRRLYETEVIKIGDMVFRVYEMIEDGSFADIYKSVGELLDDLCFESREQIDEFCRVHRDKLRTDGYATFFLFKVDGNFFVASVHVDDDGRLHVFVYEFSFDYVWLAEFGLRFVIPQQ